MNKSINGVFVLSMKTNEFVGVCVYFTFKFESVVIRNP